MDASPPLPFNQHSDDELTARELRSQGHALLKAYEDNCKYEFLDQAENIGWAAYNASKDDDDLYGAHFLIAKTLLFKGRLRSALYYVGAALDNNKNDESALTLKRQIEAAQRDATKISEANKVPSKSGTVTRQEKRRERSAAFRGKSQTRARALPQDDGGREAIQNPRPKLYAGRFMDEGGDGVSDAPEYDMDIEDIPFEAYPWPEDIKP